MAHTTPNLGLKSWENGPDLYNHTELSTNWDKLDLVVLNRQGGTATGLIRWQGSTSTTALIAARVSTDTQDRLSIRADGRLSFSSGSATADVNVYRSGTSALKIEGTLTADNLTVASSGVVAVRQQTLGNVSFATAIAADTQDRLQITGDGKVLFGSGSASSDVNLYRSGVGSLKTDQSLTVAGTLTAGSIAQTGSTLGFYGVTPVTRRTGWSVANVTPTRIFDTDSQTIAQLADAVGTIINDLIAVGIFG